MRGCARRAPLQFARSSPVPTRPTAPRSPDCPQPVRRRRAYSNTRRDISPARPMTARAAPRAHLAPPPACPPPARQPPHACRAPRSSWESGGPSPSPRRGPAASPRPAWIPLPVRGGPAPASHACSPPRGGPARVPYLRASPRPAPGFPNLSPPMHPIRLLTPPGQCRARGCVTAALPSATKADKYPK